MLLFQGNEKAYGKFTYTDKVRDDGKVKGTGVTVRSPVSLQLWDEHLSGIHQLGIIPINENSETKFGAIDIDDYNVKKEVLNEKIYQHKLPVILFRSKSGGAHLFMFTSEYVSAGLIQRKLHEIAAFLGYGNAEVFPKQTQILKERGDIGQWINMPYFDHNKTTRFAYRSEDGEKMGIKDFLAYAESKKIAPYQLENFQVPVQQELPQGPPCLQHLITQGFPDGTRNQGLFNLGVYAQKADPDKWQKLIEEFNQKYMQPPLSPREVLTTIGSLAKKEYNYACKKQPICNHCNIGLCRTRKYGVGEASGMPAFGTLTKLDTDPPIWFIDVDGGGRLELTTEELQNPTLFQRKCLERLNIMPTVPKRVDWQVIVANLVENVTVVPIPKESTPAGQLLIHLEEFCTNRVGDENAECLLRGLVWNYDGKHHFRMQDFMQYLERKRFFEFKHSQVVAIFRDNKGVAGPTSAGNRTISVWSFPVFKQDVTKFIPPKQNDGDVPF